MGFAGVDGSVGPVGFLLVEVREDSVHHPSWREHKIVAIPCPEGHHPGRARGGREKRMVLAQDGQILCPCAMVKRP